jgi:hypothetical protein
MDVFDDPKALEMPADLPSRRGKVASLSKHRAKKRHEVDDFYHAPCLWVDAAGEAVCSAQQVICAMRIYRLWRMLKHGAETVTVGNKICDHFVTRKIKGRTLALLEAAGLIEIISRGRRGMGQAPVIRVVEKAAEG